MYTTDARNSGAWPHETNDTLPGTSTNTNTRKYRGQSLGKPSPSSSPSPLPSPACFVGNRQENLLVPHQTTQHSFSGHGNHTLVSVYFYPGEGGWVPTDQNIYPLRRGRGDTYMHGAAHRVTNGRVGCGRPLDAKRQHHHHQHPNNGRESIHSTAALALLLNKNR